MPPVIREDPYGGYNFEVTVNGVSDDGKAAKGSFSEVSGLEVGMEPIVYRNGSEDRERKLRSIPKFTDITLKRGITGDIDFWNWIVQAIAGQVVRTDGSIILLDEARQEVMRWNFTRGWPCKFTGPGLNAANGEVAFETVTLCYEDLTIDGQGG